MHLSISSRLQRIEIPFANALRQLPWQQAFTAETRQAAREYEINATAK